MLTEGSGLGPYDIVASLGAGGMGEVYRARDTRLDRTVAIKVLAAHRISDPLIRQALRSRSPRRRGPEPSPYLSPQ